LKDKGVEMETSKVNGKNIKWNKRQKKWTFFNNKQANFQTLIKTTDYYPCYRINKTFETKHRYAYSTEFSKDELLWVEDIFKKFHEVQKFLLRKKHELEGKIKRKNSEKEFIKKLQAHDRLLMTLNNL